MSDLRHGAAEAQSRREIWRHRQLKRAQRTGVSLASIVGTAPSWARQ
jgi:hypothetical protein